MAEGEPLRILVVGMKWPPETFLGRLLDGLSRRGFEITVAGPARPRDAMFRRSGLHFLWMPSREGGWPSRVLRRVRAVLAGPTNPAANPVSTEGVATCRVSGALGHAERLGIASQRWDLIYFPWNSAAIAMFPMFDMGIPVAVSCRGSQIKIAPHNPSRTAIQSGLEATFRRAALVHCVSQDILDEARAYGLDPDKAHVIRPAVDPTFFLLCDEKASASGGPLRIITTGSLIWTKGHELAVTALGRLRDRGIAARLEIIGEGSERARILYTAHDLGLADSVALLGQLAPEQVRERLRAADVFLLSSHSEGISNAALEAMACGLPVVTTDCGGMREAVDDGVEGLVIPVREPQSIADALARLASDPELRHRMGQAARRRVEHEFDLERQLDRWAELCHRTIAEWRARG